MNSGRSAFSRRHTRSWPSGMPIPSLSARSRLPIAHIATAARRCACASTRAASRSDWPSIGEGREMESTLAATLRNQLQAVIADIMAAAAAAKFVRVNDEYGRLVAALQLTDGQRIAADRASE